jgi:hypothetical protein
MRKPDMMGATVNTVDHGIGCAFQFVVQTTIKESSDNGILKAFARKDIVCCAARDAACLKPTMDPFDDVAALAEFAQGWCCDLTFERIVNVAVCPVAKVLRDQILSPRPHPVLDIVARDDEVFAIIGTAPCDDMDVRVFGVPMIDADPIQFCSQILFCLVHQVACEGFEVGHIDGVLW